MTWLHRFLCRIGFHAWKTCHKSEPFNYRLFRTCTRCGKRQEHFDDSQGGWWGVPEELRPPGPPKCPEDL